MAPHERQLANTSAQGPQTRRHPRLPQQTQPTRGRIMTVQCTHWDPHQAGAAGLLLVGKTKVLLQLRSQSVREPGTWGIPGGARGQDETAAHTAGREAREETGIDPESVKIVARYTHRCACGWTFVTCVAIPTSPSTLSGNWETERLELVPLTEVTHRALHPGLRAAWPDLRDIIRAPDMPRPNISEVGPQLWTGGQRRAVSMATHVAQLEALGISHVIDCRPEGQPDQAYVQRHAPQIDYLHLPQPDVGQAIPDQWFADGVDYALRALNDPAAKVLIHCQLGINRGPSMAFAVLLANGMTPDQARYAIVSARPIARLAYADQAAAWWAKLTAPDVFYHAGPKGMHAGDILIPPSESGVTPTADRIMATTVASGFASYPEDIAAAMASGSARSLASYLKSPRHQSDLGRVFVTQTLPFAKTFAAQHPDVCVVYRVEPLSVVEKWSDGFLSCDRARIVGVVMEATR
jgi:dual specificity phosphatase 3